MSGRSFVSVPLSILAAHQHSTSTARVWVLFSASSPRRLRPASARCRIARQGSALCLCECSAHAERAALFAGGDDYKWRSTIGCVRGAGELNNAIRVADALRAEVGKANERSTPGAPVDDSKYESGRWSRAQLL